MLSSAEIAVIIDTIHTALYKDCEIKAAKILSFDEAMDSNKDILHWCDILLLAKKSAFTSQGKSTLQGELTPQEELIKKIMQVSSFTLFGTSLYQNHLIDLKKKFKENKLAGNDFLKMLEEGYIPFTTIIASSERRGRHERFAAYLKQKIKADQVGNKNEVDMDVGNNFISRKPT